MHRKKNLVLVIEAGCESLPIQCDLALEFNNWVKLGCRMTMGKLLW